MKPTTRRQAADRLIAHLDDDTIAKAQAAFAKTDSVGQHRMASLHNGKRENLEISPNLWAGVGLVRGGAGTALVGDGPTVAARINEYAALGIDSFILSGYPHLEEAYKVGELLFPHGCRYPGNSAATSASVAGRSRGKRVYPEKSRAKLRSHHVCNRTKWLLRAAPWFLPVGIVLVWQLASSTGWLSSRILPSPEGVVEAFWSLSASGELWQHLAISPGAR